MTDSSLEGSTPTYSSDQAWKRTTRTITTVASFATFSNGARTTGFATLAAVVAPNPWIIGLISAASILPWLLLAQSVGPVVDSARRSRILQAAGTGGLILSLVLLGIFVWYGVPWAVLLVFAALFSSVHVFLDVTANRLLVDTVPDEALPRANGRMSAWQSSMAVLAPACAAVALGYSEHLFALLVVTIFGGIVVVCARFSSDEVSSPSARVKGDWRRPHGIRMLYRTKGLLALASSVSLMNLYSGIFATMLPLLILQSPGSELHYVGFAFAIQAGAMLLGVWTASRLIDKFKIATRALLVVSAAMKLPVFALVIISGDITLILVAVILNGISAGFWNAPSSTALLRLSRGDYQTDTIASYKMLASLGAPFGALLGGAVAGAFGLTASFWLGLVLAGIVSGIIAYRVRHMNL